MKEGVFSGYFSVVQQRKEAKDVLRKKRNSRKARSRLDVCVCVRVCGSHSSTKALSLFVCVETDGSTKAERIVVCIEKYKVKRHY